MKDIKASSLVIVEDGTIQETMMDLTNVDDANVKDVNMEDNVIIEPNMGVSSDENFTRMENVHVDVNPGMSLNPQNYIEIHIKDLKQSKYSFNDINITPKGKKQKLIIIHHLL